MLTSAGTLTTGRSTGGFAICVGGGATQRGSRLQPYGYMSSTKSEYTTAPKVSCEIVRMRYLFKELGYDTTHPSHPASRGQQVGHPDTETPRTPKHHQTHSPCPPLDMRTTSSNKRSLSPTYPETKPPPDIFANLLGRIKFAKFRAMPRIVRYSGVFSITADSVRGVAVVCQGGHVNCFGCYDYCHTATLFVYACMCLILVRVIPHAYSLVLYT